MAVVFIVFFCEASFEETFIYQQRQKFLELLEEDLIQLKKGTSIVIGREDFELFSELDEDDFSLQIIKLINNYKCKIYIITRSKNCKKLLKIMESFHEKPAIYLSFFPFDKAPHPLCISTLEEVHHLSDIFAQNVDLSILYGPIHNHFNFDILKDFLKHLDKSKISVFQILVSRGEKKTFQQEFLHEAVEDIHTFGLKIFFPYKKVIKYLDELNRVIVCLHQMWTYGYVLGKEKRHYQRVIYELSKLKNQDFLDFLNKEELTKYPGLGEKTLITIKEILNGDFRELENLESTYFLEDKS